MSFEDSKRAGDAINTVVNKYLLDMKAPISLIDKVNAKSSGEVEILSNDYVDKYLSGFSPDYQEWLIAKCGDEGKYSNLMIQSKELYEKYEDITFEIYRCKLQVLLAETERKFYSSIRQAIRLADPKLIPRRSLLAYI
jgi:hypothetical protein